MFSAILASSHQDLSKSKLLNKIVLKNFKDILSLRDGQFSVHVPLSTGYF